MQIRFEIAFDRGKFFRGANFFFGLLARGERFLGLFLVLPEIGRGDARFEIVQQLLLCREVKDSSAPAPCARAVGRNDAGDLR